MLDSLRALNDTDVTPEQAVKVINALAASGVSTQMAAGAAAVVGAAVTRINVGGTADSFILEV
jgi:hypothetical protein